MKNLYDNVCRDCCKLVTNRYSTSFSLGIKLFHKKFRSPIYGIYGFVRFADEIVDTFHNYNKKELLKNFRCDAFKAISNRISSNPILHSFQEVVNDYLIDHSLIDAFLKSMEFDLEKKQYGKEYYKEYIYGSAEVVGLMCLKVFCERNSGLYEELKISACHLGAAFQKVNFLRDMKSDFVERGRVYFPGVDYINFNNEQKQHIEKDILRDFEIAYQGILRLPRGARFGVYIAYVYYFNLFKKIMKSPASRVQEKRIRVPDFIKFYLLMKSTIKYKLSLL